jgi:hypothetical protein
MIFRIGVLANLSIALSFAACKAQEGTAVSAGALDGGKGGGAVALPEFVGKKEPLPAEIRRKISGAKFEDGKSWWPECPTKLDELAYLTLSYVGFDGKAHVGNMIVRDKLTPEFVKYLEAMNVLADKVDPKRRYLIPEQYRGPGFKGVEVADGMIEVFRRLYSARFAIKEMKLVDEYKNDDEVSMAQDNTYAFSCYPRDLVLPGGAKLWYQHSFGVAVDINPIQNPYITRDSTGKMEVSPTAGEQFANRGPLGFLANPQKADAAGVMVSGGTAYRAFAEVFGAGFGWKWGGEWKSAIDYMHFSWNDM